MTTRMRSKVFYKQGRVAKTRMILFANHASVMMAFTYLP